MVAKARRVVDIAAVSPLVSAGGKKKDTSAPHDDGMSRLDEKTGNAPR